MKKQYFHLLCLLLGVLIFYCFSQIDGFLTIDAGNLCISDDTGGGPTCEGSTITDMGGRGPQGHVCQLPGSTTGYNLIVSEANLNSGVSFNPGDSFDCDTSTHERLDPLIPPTATPCFSHNGEIGMHGCIEQCPIDPNSTGFNTTTTTLPASVPNGTHDLQGVSCSAASIPATNSCYGPDGIIINSITTQPACDRTPGNTWYVGGAGTELQAVCHSRSDAGQGGPVQPYKIIGCEEGCFRRGGAGDKPNYITSLNDDEATITSHGEHREVIYIGEEQISGQNDPYEITEVSMKPDNSFDVTPTCSQSVTTSNGSIAFDSPFADPVAQKCNLAVGTFGSDHLESRRYSVSGCYPQCSDSDRCINMIFTYPSGDAPGHDEFKTQLLASYIENGGQLGTQGNAEQEFKNDIYYYRKYRHDGVDHIEAQFKCVGDTCEFVDATLEAAVHSLGGDAVLRIAALATERGLDQTAIDQAIAIIGDSTTLYDIQAAAGLNREGNPFAVPLVAGHLRQRRWALGDQEDTNCNETCVNNYGSNSKCVDDAPWEAGNIAQINKYLTGTDGNNILNSVFGTGALNDNSVSSSVDPARALRNDPSQNEFPCHTGDEIASKWFSGSRSDAASDSRYPGVNPQANAPPVILTSTDLVTSGIGGEICRWQPSTERNIVVPEICTTSADKSNLGNDIVNTPASHSSARQLCQCYVSRQDICRARNGVAGPIASSVGGFESDEGLDGSTCTGNLIWDPWEEP